MQDAKPLWASKTFIVNIVALIAAVAGGYGFDLDAEVQASLVTGALAVANIVLRIVTTEPVRVRKPQETSDE